jgi:hypothetical protein
MQWALTNKGFVNFVEVEKKIICSPAGNTRYLLPATISVRRDISDWLNSGISGRELLFVKGPKSWSANCLPTQFTDSNGGCILFLKKYRCWELYLRNVTEL